MSERSEKKDSRVIVPPELVAEARGGDQAAFAELYALTNAALYRTVRSMVRDEELAWDILQDTYLRAYQSLDKLEADGAFLPWLRRIAVNEAATQMKRRQPVLFTDLNGEDGEAREPEIPDLSIGSQPELALDRKESSRLVREILADLPEQQQLVLGMHYYEDMPIKEIAEALHVAPGTVKAQLFQGRKKVETRVRALEKQGVKLYGLGPIPFLVALLRKLEPAAQVEQKTLSAVLSAAPAASGTADAAAVNMTAMTAGQAFLHGLGAKLLAGALVVALLAGAGKLAYDAAKRSDPPVGPERPPMTETIKLAETGDTADPAELPDPAAIPENACGPDLTWRFDSDTGTLTIEGGGDMYDYTNMYEGEMTPWYDFQHDIQALVLPDGLRSIGSLAFEGCGLTEVTIPEGVTSIGKQAFCISSLRSVTLPETLTVIGDSAFSGCSELCALTIPESVTTIGSQAFSDTGLRTVTIPAQVSAIGSGAFSTNADLRSFSVDPENPYFTAGENGVLYSKDSSTLVACSSRNSGHFEIPEGVTAIGDGAFHYCSRLSSVTIPESVTSIGKNAFADCHSLRSLTIPAGVRSIEAGTFAYCAELRSVTIPEGLTSIGNFAFCQSGLTGLTLPKSVTHIDPDAFDDCAALTAFSVHPENPVFSSGENGVLYDRDRTELLFFPPARSGDYTLPTGISSIRDNAFSHCVALTAVTIPEGVTSIGDSAFSECTGLTAVTIPDSLTSIGDCAFAWCYGLRSLTIPAGVSSFGEDIFNDCSDLTLSVYAGSAAEAYAEENDIPFVVIEP